MMERQMQTRAAELNAGVRPGGEPVIRVGQNEVGVRGQIRGWGGFQLWGGGGIDTALWLDPPPKKERLN